MSARNMGTSEHRQVSAVGGAVNHEHYNHGFSHGLIFGACLAFGVTIAAVWSLQPTEAEDVQRCQDMLEAGR